MLYRARFVFAGLLTVAFLLFVSAMVTTVGAHTILDTKTPLTATWEAGAGDTPNAVTAEAAVVWQTTQHILLSTGRALYASCQWLTTATVYSGESITHGTATAAGGLWHGTVSTGRAVGNGTMFVLHVPGRIVGSITRGHTVNALIRPADDSRVPTISAETSAAALANLNAAQQQQIARLLSAQLAANRNLGGTIVAGDLNHGGYPTKWDSARQDSTIDSWGMYNRECVSYAAWKVYQTFGTMPYWGGVGNANEWPGDARRAGIATGSVPRVHSVAISMYGYYGHAMWVEKVSGNMIYVSQYNYDLHGHYSEMWLDGSKLTYIYFS